MKRIESIRNQYQFVNISLFDFLVTLDDTKSKKYVPLLCKVLEDRLENINLYGQIGYDKVDNQLNELSDKYKTLSLIEKVAYAFWYEIFPSEFYELFKDFKEFNERGLIEQNDILKYKSIDELRNAVNVASIKTNFKELEGQVFKNYEDDTWLMLRPLTFEASIKYGANTKWCTTYKKEKDYFARYWRYGILVYFINKINGEKYAVYKGVRGDMDRDISWWNAEDRRIDFTLTTIDGKLLPAIKEVLNSEKTNKDLCSSQLKVDVELNCDPKFYSRLLGNNDYNVEQLKLQFADYDNIADEINEIGEERIKDIIEKYNNFSKAIGPMDDTVERIRRELIPIPNERA